MDFSSFSPALIITVVVALALAPFVAVMVTSFTKIVVVLSLLRNALGLQQVPPNVVLNGLAIILSVYVMNPVITDTYRSVQSQISTQAPGPMNLDKLGMMVQVGKEPLRQFLIKHSHQVERDFFLQSAKRLLPPDRQSDLTSNDYLVIMPAFTVSELTEAFQIGFLLFLPFLVIDLVVSNILLAMGMMMLSPTMVSLPFKLLLFILLSGWAKLIHGLVLTYQ
ncbi:type III secretion system export apparatus subunit SctR [Dyella acidisoli]|uniref:EscR/YscR/HrcR family type III secretion system export apparatus protein n=1 Tax=Dyella acidisoli TaxID=1867834 RepID=A0ABQ5XRJ5_9GAMM|nr:type III secretion system export apparatus subunit SctR [Dyella acidisoli]GLQ93653.1 EscR/YscR/HrcR family type III secretion system export apparatus protein [Dyella acidisoli]